MKLYIMSVYLTSEINELFHVNLADFAENTAQNKPRGSFLNSYGMLNVDYAVYENEILISFNVIQQLQLVNKTQSYRWTRVS